MAKRVNVGLAVAQFKHVTMHTKSSELRKFGLMLGPLIAGVFGVLFPWLNTEPFPVWPWIVGSAVGVPAIVAPMLLAPVYLGWMTVAAALNWIVTRVVLGAVFYLVMLPLGTVMRLLKKSPLQCRSIYSEGSFRKPSQRQTNDHMERPY